MHRNPSIVPTSLGRRAAVIVLSCIVISLFILYSRASQSITHSVEVSTPVQAGCCEQDDKKPHLLVGTFYSLKDNQSARLLLNNKGPNPLVAQPSLFSMNGERFDPPPVTIDGKSFRMINLSDWVSAAGPQFQDGSIQVFHVGRDLILGAQIYLIDEGRSLSFDEKLIELASFKSSKLEGLWWLPSQKGKVQLALSNTSNTLLTVSVDASGRKPERNGHQTIDLAPRQTRLIDVQSDVMNHENGAMSKYGGISIQHSGAAGDLLARAFAEDGSLGYSLAVQFSDPAAAKSSDLQGVGLRVGSAGSELVKPLVVMRNVGTQSATVTGRVPYTRADGTTDIIALPELRLSAGDSATVDISEAMREHNHPWTNGIGGLEFHYSTAPGSVLITAFSVSDSGNQIFRVPMWDVAAQRSPTGGYPWYVDGNSSTAVYIKNTTNETQQYFLQLNYSGGVYSIGMKQLEAGQTITYDLRKLRDEQVPDNRGRLIPLGVSSGQVHWSANGSGMLIGRSEQADLVAGTSSNYACMNCCGDIPNAQQVIPGSASVDADSSYNFTAQEQFRDCYENVG